MSPREPSSPFHASKNAKDEFHSYFSQYKAEGVDGRYWQTLQYCEYLPEEAQDAYLNEDLVRQLCNQLYNGYDMPPIEDLMGRYRKVFAILLYIGKPELIESFMARQSLRSARLPFSRSESVPCQDAVFGEFYEAQWKFCVNAMRYADLAEHDTRQVLPFEVITQLGEGQSGKAYLIRVHHLYDELTATPDTTHEYVIKCCRSNNIDQQETKETWLKEARSHAGVRKRVHREIAGIVEFYGSFSHGNAFCILLEYADFGNLEHALQVLPAPTDLHDILDFWHSYLTLLTTLTNLRNLRYGDDENTYQLCHFDIKPSNILVFTRDSKRQYDLQLKLGDLGSSRHSRLLEGSMNRLKQNAGTRTYGAPELYPIDSRGDTLLPADVDPSIDLYSFGCIATELVAWVEGGLDGVDHYRFLRRTANKYHHIEDKDAFHNTVGTLEAVFHHLAYLKGRIHPDCSTIVVIDLVTTGMLRDNPWERTEPRVLMHDAKQKLETVRKMLLHRQNSTVPDRRGPPVSPRSNTAPQPLPNMAKNAQGGKIQGYGISSGPSAFHAFDTVTTNRSRGVSAPEASTGISLRLRGGEAPPILHQSFSLDADRRREPARHVHADTETTLGLGEPLNIPLRTANTGIAVTSRQESDIPRDLPSKEPSSLSSNYVDSSHAPISLEDAKAWMKSAKSAKKFMRSIKPTYKDDSQYWDRLAKEFEGRDFILLVDDSGSMHQHWLQVIDCVELLAFCTAPYDDDGIEIHFTVDGTTRIRVKNSDDAKKHVTKMVPPAANPKHPRKPNMHKALSLVLKNFFDKISSGSNPATPKSKREFLASRIGVAPKPLKGLVVFVLSDGLWDDNDVRKPIDRVAKALLRPDLDETIVGIQFIHFGSIEENSHGWDRMKQLDDAFDPDIVDVEMFPGSDVSNILLGSINKSMDRRNDRPLSQVSTSTTGPSSPRWSPPTHAQVQSPTSSLGHSPRGHRASSSSNYFHDMQRGHATIEEEPDPMHR